MGKGTRDNKNEAVQEQMPTGLTTLERELINYLQRLSGQYSDLEQRSNTMIVKRQGELEDLLNLLFASQASLVEGLSEFVNVLVPAGAQQDPSAAMTRQAMAESLQAIRQAQQHMADLQPIEPLAEKPRQD